MQCTGSQGMNKQSFMKTQLSRYNYLDNRFSHNEKFSLVTETWPLVFSN